MLSVTYNENSSMDLNIWLLHTVEETSYTYLCTIDDEHL